MDSVSYELSSVAGAANLRAIESPSGDSGRHLKEVASRDDGLPDASVQSAPRSILDVPMSELGSRARTRRLHDSDLPSPREVNLPGIRRRQAREHSVKEARIAQERVRICERRDSLPACSCHLSQKKIVTEPRRS